MASDWNVRERRVVEGTGDGMLSIITATQSLRHELSSWSTRLLISKCRRRLCPCMPHACGVQYTPSPYDSLQGS